MDRAEEPSPPEEGRGPTGVDLNAIWLQVEDPDSLGVLVLFSANRTFAIDDGGELATKQYALGRFGLNDYPVRFERAAMNATEPEAGVEPATPRLRIPSGS